MSLSIYKSEPSRRRDGNMLMFTIMRIRRRAENAAPRGKNRTRRARKQGKQLKSTGL